MTQPDELLPERAANYDSLATFAAKTEEDWNDELTVAEENRWGAGGLLGGLFEGLAEGKPFVVALLEAIVNEIFEGLLGVYNNVVEAFEGLAANFSGKWRDLVDANDAANYANAQHAVRNRAIIELFDGPAGALSANWTINYYSDIPAGGTLGQDGNGNCWWNGFGGVTRTGRARWNAATTATDRQIISTVMPLQVQAPLLGGDSFTRLLGRMDAAGTTFVYGEIGNNTAAVGCVVAGVKTEFDSVAITPQKGDTWDFLVGSVADSYQFRLRRNGIVVVNFTDDTAGVHVSTMGAANRYVGFEMTAGSRLVLFQTSPGTMAVFSADDQ